MKRFIQNNWGIPTSTCRPLGGAGGFSGASFWRIESDRGEFCLRRWPQEHPTSEQLKWIHQVLFHVEAQGFTKCPVPLAANRTSFVSDEQFLWQLEPWLTGAADFSSHPTCQRLLAAMRTLAQFHLAGRSLDVVTQPSPAMTTRHRRIDFLRDQIGKIQSALTTPVWSRLASIGNELLSLFCLAAPTVQRQLKQAAQRPIQLQPCIRDIWHDHVLFEDDQVSGIIDFGAMRIESVAGDIARLLGSLVADDAAAWKKGLAAYEEVRPLSPLEHRLTDAFDASTVLCSGLNWLTWLIVEQRQFDNWDQIVPRLLDNLARLRHLVELCQGP